jgi:ribosomal protein L32
MGGTYFMPEKSGKKAVAKNSEKQILFKCKFCGEMKLLNDMIVMRQYFPQISVCRDCAKSNLNHQQTN